MYVRTKRKIGVKRLVLQRSNLRKMKKIKNIRKRAPRALSFSLSLSRPRSIESTKARERERNRATLEKFSNESDFKRDREKILHNIHISFSPARSRIFIIVSSSHTKKCLLPRCAGTSTRSWPWSVRRRSRRRCSKLNDAKFKRRNVFHQYYTTHASAHISERRKTCGRDGNKTPRRETRAKRSIAQNAANKRAQNAKPPKKKEKAAKERKRERRERALHSLVGKERKESVLLVILTILSSRGACLCLSRF